MAALPRHLARDEMRSITEDKWDEKVWGAATAEGTNERDTAHSNLTLYWGQGVNLSISNCELMTMLTYRQDKWVANHTRDELINAHGHRSPVQSCADTDHWEPTMLIDRDGIPHDFCTTYRNSNTVAHKAKLWVDGIIESHHTAMSRLR